MHIHRWMNLSDPQAGAHSKAEGVTVVYLVDYRLNGFG